MPARLPSYARLPPASRCAIPALPRIPQHSDATTYRTTYARTWFAAAHAVPLLPPLHTHTACYHPTYLPVLCSCRQNTPPTPLRAHTLLPVVQHDTVTLRYRLRTAATHHICSHSCGLYLLVHAGSHIVPGQHATRWFTAVNYPHSTTPTV